MHKEDIMPVRQIKKFMDKSNDKHKNPNNSDNKKGGKK